MDITAKLLAEANRYSGIMAELLEGAASEIDLLRDEKTDLEAKLKGAYVAGTNRGAEIERAHVLAAIDAEFELSAPCWCKGSNEGEEPKTCDCCNFIANLKDRIASGN